MHTHIALIQFTDQGLRELAQSPARAAAFRDKAAASGITVVGQYWTTGTCDGVLILQSENHEAIHRLMASLVAAGNVRATTLEAFDAAQFARIVAA